MMAGQVSLLAVLCCSALATAATALAVSPSESILNALQDQTTITTLNSSAALELNPYGLALITKTQGNLVAGNFLATNWNDNQNNPGQGHSILQVTRYGYATIFATIDPLNYLVTQNCGNFGVGLTMALAILSKGYVIVGSTPIPVGGTVAGPGCLLVLDSYGNLLDAHAADEPTTTSGVRTGGGPWAFATQESSNGAQVNLFVSYVLGTCPSCTSTQTGAQGGKVVRYQLQVPDNNWSSHLFWGLTPDVIAWGFPTQPGNIGGGAVGPTGLLLVKDPAHKDRLFVSNNLNNSVVGIPFPGGCYTRPDKKPACAWNPHVWDGLVQGPIGLALSPYGTIVGANGLLGTLFEFRPATFFNKQLADQLVNNLPAQVGAGALFNVLFLDSQTLVFNDDAFNTFNTLTPWLV